MKRRQHEDAPSQDDSETPRLSKNLPSWSAEEDCALVSAVTLHRTNWRNVSKVFRKQFRRGPRSPEDCRARFEFLQRRALPWSPAEDLLLIYTCSTCVGDWTRVPVLASLRDPQSVVARIAGMALETARSAKQSQPAYLLGAISPLSILQSLFCIRLFLSFFKDPELVPKKIRAKIISAIEQTELKELDCSRLLGFMMPARNVRKEEALPALERFMRRATDRLFANLCTLDSSYGTEDLARLPEVDPVVVLAQDQGAAYVQPYYVMPASAYYYVYSCYYFTSCYVNILM